MRSFTALDGLQHSPVFTALASPVLQDSGAKVTIPCYCGLLWSLRMGWCSKSLHTGGNYFSWRGKRSKVLQLLGRINQLLFFLPSPPHSFCVVEGWVSVLVRCRQERR